MEFKVKGARKVLVKTAHIVIEPEWNLKSHLVKTINEVREDCNRTRVEFKEE